MKTFTKNVVLLGKTCYSLEETVHRYPIFDF
jgi:hypothetical protein